MKIVIAIMLIIFCVYETVSLVKSIPKWREEARKRKELNQQNNNDTNGDVGDPDSK